MGARSDDVGLWQRAPRRIEHLTKRNLPPNVEASVMDSEELSFEDKVFTHSFTSLVLMASTGPDKVAKEIHHMLKAGGVALAST
jgi:ubiquinone/menaquinone biosynthesis C-methylase UbiE